MASLGLRCGAPLDGSAGPRPRVVGVMIASVDGRATIDGRSVKLGHPEDRALLRELRTGADVVLAGSRTLITERYANLLDSDQRAARVAAGLAPHPVIATISRSLTLRAADVPVFAELGVRVAVYAERQREGRAAALVDGAAADLSVHELERVDFPAVLAHMHAAYGACAVSCEGGPSLLRELAAQGCLDELLITVAPLLVAGEGPAPTAGPLLAPPLSMALASVHRADDHLFVRYTA